MITPKISRLCFCILINSVLLHFLGVWVFFASFFFCYRSSCTRRRQFLSKALVYYRFLVFRRIGEYISISVLRWHGIPSAIFFLSALQNRADHEFRPARLVYKQPSTKHLWTPRKPLSRAWLDPNKRQGTASDRGAGTRPTPKSFPVVGIVQSKSGCGAGIRLG